MAYVGGFLGTYRLVHRDSNDNTIAELLEKLAAEFGIVVVGSTPETDAQKMPKVKKGLSTIMKEDDKLVLMGKPNAALTFDVDQFTWDLRIPVTFRNIRSGVVYEKTLEYADFTDLILAAGDQTSAAGQWYNLLTYTVPAQSEMKLGHSIQDVRVDSALNLAWDTNKA
jgi:hypothetical protein